MDKLDLTTPAGAAQLNTLLQPLPWDARLKTLATRAQGQVALSSSLSYEDQALTHVVATHALPVTVFTLDTGRLFPESYDVLHATQKAYPDVDLKVFYPDTHAVQHWVETHGINGLYEALETRKSCCYVRKVEPLNRALEGVCAWVTGLRAEHSDSRKDMPIAEFDVGRGLTKVNPLIDALEKDVIAYIRAHEIPYNTLHKEGYPSIGCAPCTRAVKPGAHPRSGRWWWEDDAKQECGLHVVDGKLVRINKG